MAVSTEDVLNHHLQAFGEGNLEAILEDYTDESLLLTPDSVLQGRGEMTPFFESLFEEFARPGTSFGMDRQIVRGEIAYIVWHAETSVNRFELGTDTFVVRDGKIVVQTFAAKITAKG